MNLQLPAMPAVQAAMLRFDNMSIRERALIGLALLVSMLVLWDSLLMRPLNDRRAALLAALDGADLPEQAEASYVSMDDATGVEDAEPPADPDPIGTALLQRESLRAQLATVEQHLQRASADLIAPERMSEVLHDVLRQQHDLTLVSLHNKPVSTLAPAPVPMEPPSQDLQQPSGSGPYLHPVELVVDGRYLDILDYLRALEALPWRLNWQALQLDASRYPLSRARIELSTLSLDPAWIGTPAATTR